MLNTTERDAVGMAPLPPALLLEVFDEPILFYRCYVTLTGSVTAALVLSCASIATEQLPDDDRDTGWFTKTSAEWQADTGLTRTELETARRKLKAQGLWHERRCGPPPSPLQYRIDQTALYEQLEVQAQRRWKGLV